MNENYVELVRQCTSLVQGKKLHETLSRAGHGSSLFIANLLIQMYGKCGSLEDARSVFDTISRRNVYSWTIMVAAYAHNGHLAEARSVFDSMPSELKNVVSWNSMVSAYVQAGDCSKALHIFRLMDLEGVTPNEVTLMTIFNGCSSAKDLQHGETVHGTIDCSDLMSNVKVGTSLVDMYGKCGRAVKAKEFFDCMPEKNLVSWNAMMGAYALIGQSTEAVKLFSLMSLEGVRPDNANFTILLDACANSASLVDGALIHSCVRETGCVSDLLVATALLNMYSSCGKLERAKEIFDAMEVHDLVAWTALLGAYAQNGHGKEAFRVFQTMDLEGFELDEACYIATIDACSRASAATQGKLVHASVVADTKFLDSSLQVGNALVDMHSKCGDLRQASEVFEKMKRKDIVSWNTIVTGYAQNGMFKQVMDLFLEMNLEGMIANAITFIGVLSVCSHAGKLTDALFYFLSMQSDYGVSPLKDHLVCVVDLLGRVGELKEAGSLTGGIPAEVSAVGWIAYLSACKLQGDSDNASRAAEQMLKLNIDNSASYILLSATHQDNG